MAEKSKILIIGGTGYIGKHIVEASAKAGHPTFLLVRESTLSDPTKAKLIDNFKNLGVTLLHVSQFKTIIAIDGALFITQKRIMNSLKMNMCGCRVIFTIMRAW